MMSTARGRCARLRATSKSGGDKIKLKLIDSALGADLLHALRSMGHGGELVICDTNFPADSVARSTTLGRLLHMENVTCPQAVKAIRSLYPLDTFVDHPAMRMQVVGKPKEILPIMTEVQAEIDAAEGKGRSPMVSVERHAFVGPDA